MGEGAGDMPRQDCVSQVDLGMLYRLQQAKWKAANTNAMRDRTIGWVPCDLGKTIVIFWPAKLSPTREPSSALLGDCEQSGAIPRGIM